jgi:hypothetical protein
LPPRHCPWFGPTINTYAELTEVKTQSGQSVAAADEGRRRRRPRSVSFFADGATVYISSRDNRTRGKQGDAQDTECLRINSSKLPSGSSAACFNLATSRARFVLYRCVTAARDTAVIKPRHDRTSLLGRTPKVRKRSNHYYSRDKAHLFGGRRPRESVKQERWPG